MLSHLHQSIQPGSHWAAETNNLSPGDYIDELLICFVKFTFKQIGVEAFFLWQLFCMFYIHVAHKGKMMDTQRTALTTWTRAAIEKSILLSKVPE